VAGQAAGRPTALPHGGVRQSQVGGHAGLAEGDGLRQPGLGGPGGHHGVDGFGQIGPGRSRGGNGRRRFGRSARKVRSDQNANQNKTCHDASFYDGAHGSASKISGVARSLRGTGSVP